MSIPHCFVDFVDFFDFDLFCICDVGIGLWKMMVEWGTALDFRLDF